MVGHMRMDATKDIATDQVDLSFDSLHLEALAHDPNNPPVEGLMSARVLLAGKGYSLHQMAASATGAVTAALPIGAIRSSLAELGGLDLRGLGLLLTKSTQEVAIRCGAAIFHAKAGTLTAQKLVIDTDPVLITGDGSLQLTSEALDLRLNGSPKHPRFLRIRSPVVVRGTLLHPSVSILGQHSTFKLLDRGKAKDVDCSALRTEVEREFINGSPNPAAQ